MPLTNPTPIVYQNMSMAINERSKAEEPKKEKTGLLGPTKRMTNDKEDDILNPSKRVASYIEDIRKLREEYKNGRA
tara:strand:+ start:1009 stop:1236 length:228 start_codon:yes stop_codon:yes gene_type:complete